jgi:hypothetical protein
LGGGFDVGSGCGFDAAGIRAKFGGDAGDSGTCSGFGGDAVDGQDG